MTHKTRNQTWLALPALLLAALPLAVHAAGDPLNSLKITEVVEKVDVLDASTKQAKVAKVNDAFKSPDVMTTGAKSRAELVAADGTVTRIGSNTVFHVVPNNRDMTLEKGSVLFSSPTGKGGGTIRSASASAAVLGTSIIVTATKTGGFKLMVLEGKAKATLPGGKTFSVEAGQLTYILPGSTDITAPISFRLRDQVAGSGLVKGFKSELPALGKINAAIKAQEKKVANGDVMASESNSDFMQSRILYHTQSDYYY